MSDYPPISYDANREEASAKRVWATKFEQEWAPKISEFVGKVSLNRDGEAVWTGRTARRFDEELNGPYGLNSHLRNCPGAFEETARKMRATADTLMEASGA